MLKITKGVYIFENVENITNPFLNREFDSISQFANFIKGDLKRGTIRSYINSETNFCYALCTMHYALCTMHYALCTMHYALCTLHRGK